MSELSNIMDDSVYLARDYSSIIKWFVNKLKFLTNNWTDLSISEPDTLSLSYIAYVSDLANYYIDHKFINTIFSKTESVKFLSDLYKITGSVLNDYQSGLIYAEVMNKSSSILSINKFDILMMKNHPEELFTCVDNYEIYPKINQQIKIVRGTPIYNDFKISDFVNGYIILPDKDINRNMINVIIDGEIELKRCDDALFCEDEGYDITQKDDCLTSLRLSPSAFRSITKNVIVIYTLNDEYKVSQDSELVLVKNNEIQYEILTKTTNDLVRPTIDEIKLIYYELLKKINTLFNETYDVSQLITGRIDYLNFYFITSSLLNSGKINYETGELTLSLTDIPENDITLSYYLYNDTERIIKETSISVSSTLIEEILEIPEGYSIEPMSLYINIDSDIVGDTIGDTNISLIKGLSKLEFDYSTSDDNIITNLLNNGYINYEYCILNLILNYVPIDSTTISYEYMLNGNTYKNMEFINITSTYIDFLLDIPNGSRIKPNSVVITNGLNIINDTGDGYLINTQSDESVLLNNIKDKLLLSRVNKEVILNKLIIKRINVSAVVYLYPTDMNLSIIQNDIEQALLRDYKKGTYKPGESVKRLSILLTIENSNPNIKYSKLLEPYHDIAVSNNQILDIGSINISFERSE